MNGGTASEKLGLDSSVKELKFGTSFSGKGGSYHTIRYDFRPASVDPSKMASLEVQGGTVTISMPNTDGQTTVFAGPRKAYQKECILIIDPETGEFTLEKLTHSIQVKQTRQERDGSTKPSRTAPAPAPSAKEHIPSQKSSTVPMQSSSSSVSSAPAPSRSQPAQSSSDRKTVTSKSSAGSSSTHRRSESPLLNVPARSSPLGRSPHLSPPSGSLPGGNNAFDALLSQHSKQQKEKPPPPPSSIPSLSSSTTFEDMLSSAAAAASPGRLSTCSSSSSIGSPDRSSKPRTPPPAQLLHTSNAKAKPLTDFTGPDKKALLSDDDDDSSSSSSSSSGSSSEDSSDEDEDHDMEVVPEGDHKLPSMPMFGEFMAAPTGPPPSAMASAGGGRTVSMPSHLLSEDLQLSETGSDSD